MATKKNVTTTATPATTYVAKQINNMHEGALHLTDALVDETLAASKKWQAVLAKAMKTGVTIMGNQQEMVFDTLETLKKQYQKGAGRAMNLVNTEVKAVKESVEQAVEEVTAEIGEAVDKVTKVTKAGRPRKNAAAAVKNTVTSTKRKATTAAKAATQDAIVATEVATKKVTAATRQATKNADAAVTEVADTLLNAVEDKTATNN